MYRIIISSVPVTRHFLLIFLNLIIVITIVVGRKLQIINFPPKSYYFLALKQNDTLHVLLSNAINVCSILKC